MAEAAKRGIGVMLDMVFNHTSDRHEWFQKALAGDEEYKDFYIFQERQGAGCPAHQLGEQVRRGAPGSMWKKFDEYYLHLFDVSQPDLNWDNPKVRREGAEGHPLLDDKGRQRFPVRRGQPSSARTSSRTILRETDGGSTRMAPHPQVSAGAERGYFGNGHRGHNGGEMSSTSMENCFHYANEDGKELSMVFNFHHLKVDFMGNEKWVLVPADFQKLKDILFSWQEGMAKHHAWNAVFWCNHDQPRVVSRFGDEGRYWKQSAKMLATMIHCLRGTPYIYQGEELGMTNPNFTDISQYRDVESINHFRILQEKGLSEADAYRILQIHSRDSGRTPMQWTDGKNAGFTGWRALD